MTGSHVYDIIMSYINIVHVLCTIYYAISNEGTLKPFGCK